MTDTKALQYYPEQYVSYLTSSSDFVINESLQEMMQLLEANENNLSSMQTQGAFKRVWNNLVGRNKDLIQINATNLQEVQKISLSVIMDLEKQNMIAREMQVKLFEQINKMENDNLELKEFIVQALNKIGDRFESIDSKVEFSILIQEIREGIYGHNSDIVSLLMILSKLHIKDLQDSRNMNLLMKSLENNNKISIDEIPLREYLTELSSIDSYNANYLLKFLNTINEHPLIYSFIKVLEYTTMDISKKKFIKFAKILNDISEEIDVDIELNSVEIVNILVQSIVESDTYNIECNEVTYNEDESIEDIYEVTYNENENIKDIYGDEYAIDKYVVITNEYGMDSELLNKFVNKASSFDGDIYIKSEDNVVSAKSILGVSSLGLEQGDCIHIMSYYHSAEQTIDNLIDLVENSCNTESSISDIIDATTESITSMFDEFRESMKELGINMDDYSEDSYNDNMYYLSFIRNTLSEVERTDMCIYIEGDNKFEAKLRNACSKYAFLDFDEEPLLLFDDTVWGSAKEGFLITNKNIHYKGILGKPSKILISNIHHIYIDTTKSNKLLINDDDEITCCLLQDKYASKFESIIDNIIFRLKIDQK